MPLFIGVSLIEFDAARVETLVTAHVTPSSEEAKEFARNEAIKRFPGKKMLMGSIVQINNETIREAYHELPKEGMQ